LDDSYTIFKKDPGQDNDFFFMNIENMIHQADHTHESLAWDKTNLWDENDHLIPEAEPYASSSATKLNHPLMIMVNEERVVSALSTFSHQAQKEVLFRNRNRARMASSTAVTN
jgi:hypothetical protein